MTPAAADVKHRAQALDVVRAAAALAVLTYHVWLYRLPDPDHPTRAGWIDQTLFEFRVGLVVFFVLSGYLLYRPLVRDGVPRTVALGAYYWRRIVRIVPAYWLALAGSILLLWSLRDTPGVRLPATADLWQFFLFLQNYSRDTLLRLDAPTWTLAVQAAFYLVFPLFLVLGARAGKRAWLVPLGLILLGVVWNWVSYNNAWGPIGRLALPAMLPYFAIGMLIAHAPPLRSRRAAVALILSGAILAVANSRWHATSGGGWLSGVFRDDPGAIGYALIILACASPMIGHLRALVPAEAFGRWSYGVFLWHLPLLLFLKGRGLMPGSAILTWLLLVGVASCAGASTWHFVEKPLLARSRGSG